MLPSPPSLNARTDRARLLEVDSLRGLAALVVVLFHYTSRFAELYRPGSETMLSVPWGHYGVNLFFIISGFVIFMTLERAQRPMDFVVSRFSRLFPAYWAALLVTYFITHLLGLPLKLVDWVVLVKNLPMIHGLFGVPHVDGVYWTLEVELLFYTGMFTLYRMRRLGHVHLAVISLLAVRWGYFIAARVLGVDLSWTISHLLILAYLPWFALGIAVYTLRQGAAGPVLQRRLAQLSAACSLLTLAFTESPSMAMLGLALAALVYLAAGGQLPLLRHKVLVWMGGISYPLYLLHENIGWSFMLLGLRHGLGIDGAALVAFVVVLGLSRTAASAGFSTQ